MEMVLKNPLGSIKTVKTGFSWTTLFFGCFPAMLRGDWKWTIIMIIAAFITGGLSWFAFPFFYNRLYIQGLLNKGYKPLDVEHILYLQSKKYKIGF